LNLLDDDEVLRALKESGCAWIEVGIETLDQEVQDQHKQRQKLSEMEETLRRVHDAGLAVCSFLVNGFPNQSLDDMRRSNDMAASLIERNLLHASYLFGLVPYPGSLLYADPTKYGMKLVQDDFRFFHEEMVPVYETPYAKPDEVHKIFLEGLQILGQAMASPSDMVGPLAESASEEYGSFWSGSHV
jgi:radical SAM superfamily enzyme YgiQ (UPF0313 family)